MGRSSEATPVTTEAAATKLVAACRGGFESSSYHTPISPLERRNIAEYITGYIDGEGCFTVTFNVRTEAKLGWELRPSFSVSQNEDRRQVLDLIRVYFGRGAIRRDYADRTVKFEIRDHYDLITKIIPHFEQYPLLSKKQCDFELFKQICELVDRHEHLKAEGFAVAVHLAYQMNGSGKRKRTKEEITRSLRRR